MKRPTAIALALSLALSACGRGNPNQKPAYGDTGLPSNCRAYVQVAIDGFRARDYTADEAMNGLERNCGVAGHLWGD